MDITTLNPEQQAAVTSRKTAEETPQQCLDRHTQAMVNGWVESDVGIRARSVYDRLLAAPSDVRDAIFTAAEEALA